VEIARGNDVPDADVANVLNPEVAAANEASALESLNLKLPTPKGAGSFVKLHVPAGIGAIEASSWIGA